MTVDGYRVRNMLSGKWKPFNQRNTLLKVDGHIVKNMISGMECNIVCSMLSGKLKLI